MHTEIPPLHRGVDEFPQNCSSWGIQDILLEKGTKIPVEVVFFKMEGSMSFFLFVCFSTEFVDKTTQTLKYYNFIFSRKNKKF